MKRILFIVCAMFVFSTSLSAQSLGDFLKGAATTVIDKVTDGKATELMLPGTWNYASPAIRLESEGELAGALANAAMGSFETKLQNAYNYVGIKAGNCSFTFGDDDTFKMVIGKRTFTGTYTYETDTHKVVLTFNSTFIKLGTMTGYAYIDGENMDLVFDCSRLFDFLVKLGSKSSMLSGLTKIAESYSGMMLGFSLSK